MKKRIKLKKAFTLAEMLIVMSVLSLVLLSAMPVIIKKNVFSKPPQQAPELPITPTDWWQHSATDPNSIRNSNIGNVGIGANLPTYRLEIKYNNDLLSFAYGNNKSRTETRDNAGLMVGAGGQSGFFETTNPSNYPTGASGSWNLLDIKSSDNVNNYSMQFAGSMTDQDLYFRKTNNNAAQAWTQLNLPVGSIIPYPSNTIPNGWLLCNGQTITQAAYPALYTVLNGSGGNATVPNLSGRTIVGVNGIHGLLSAGGEETHVLSVNEMPAHSHVYYRSNGGSGGAGYNAKSDSSGSTEANWTDGVAQGYGGQAHNNMKPYLALNYIIKY